MTPVRASSSVVKVRLYSTLPMTMAMTTTASSSHIAVVDMIYFPSNFPKYQPKPMRTCQGEALPSCLWQDRSVT